MLNSHPDTDGNDEAMRRGRRVLLRSVVRGDYDFLYNLAASPEASFRWRYRGGTPSPELFASHLWDGVAAQFVVVEHTRGERVGVVSFYNANFQHGYGFLAVAGAPAYRRSGYMMEATLMFIDYLFRTWQLRRIYVETLEFNIDQFATGLDRFLHEEARLREHEYYDGRYWDLVTFRLDREHFEQYAPRYLAALTAHPEAT